MCEKYKDDYIALKKNHTTQTAIQEIQKNVPRGTFPALEAFVELLLKWNKQINLISRASEESVWPNHILDSLEVLKHITMKNPSILDVGSGAGFPGMILSIVTGWQTVLVERNQKKCAFLREAQLVTCANATIENKSAEDVFEYRPDIITSRGVATIKSVLNMVAPLLHQDCQVVLWKGHECQKEIADALNKPWNFQFQCHESSIRGMIVILSNFTKA